MAETLRKATIDDIRPIQALINGFAKQDLMLPRSLNELYENIRDFWVLERNGKISACAALHVSWDDLAEIKSVAVSRPLQRKGVGTRLARACMEEAVALGAKKVFALTYKPEFFRSLGFRRVRHVALPHKIWAECINCPKFPDCDETALLKTIAKK
ncbi:MAG: N-acetyltransferase [Deltaproteobacteria bacterium]